jgi:hypothetical protein
LSCVELKWSCILKMPYLHLSSALPQNNWMWGGGWSWVGIITQTSQFLSSMT